MSRHMISQAVRLFFGKAQYNPAHNSKIGVEMTPVYLHDFGAPAAAVADGLIKAATSTELPDDETITYTFPAASASPTDGSLNDGEFDVPRNVVAAVTHQTSIVAMTIVVTGKDQYGETVVEQLDVSATGTSKSVAGKKAFKSVSKIEISSASDATANTVNIGTGDVLGLPYRVDANGLVAARGANAADTGTFVPADTTEATATTGDVRGTYDPSTTLNGSNRVAVLIKIANPGSKVGAYGVAQYGG